MESIIHNDTEKEDFYSNQNIEDITAKDYMHAKRVGKDFEIQKSGEYHDVYIQSNTLLLDDVFKRFSKMYLKVYKLDPAHFISAPELGWQAVLQKTKVKLELFTDIYISLMMENGIRGEICCAIH